MLQGLDQIPSRSVGYILRILGQNPTEDDIVEMVMKVRYASPLYWYNFSNLLDIYQLADKRKNFQYCKTTRWIIKQQNNFICKYQGPLLNIRRCWQVLQVNVIALFVMFSCSNLNAYCQSQQFANNYKTNCSYRKFLLALANSSILFLCKEESVFRVTYFPHFPHLQVC